MFYTYIIYSKKLDRYYTGSTDNISTRLSQHNSGLSTYTAKARDWVLVYQRTFTSRQEAAQHERFIKNKKSRTFIEWLINKK